MRLYLLLILLLSRVVSFSQDNYNLQAKYWMYRDRFEKYFVENHYSLHTPFAYGAGNYQGNFTITENLTINGFHHIADNTWYEGMYIGVLATEYKLLKINGYDNEANRTLEELKNVLKTINRYDRVAEDIFYYNNNYYYEGGSTIITEGNICDVPYEPLNGFFVRHDNYCGHFEAMSQDQVWSLYTGLALVKKLVDDTWTNNECKGITHRITNAMHHWTMGDHHYYNGTYWEIYLPDNSYDGDYSHILKPKIFQPNTDVTWLKYGHAEAAHFITDLNEHAGTSEDLSSKETFKIAMDNVWQFIGFNVSFKFNAYGITALDCIGNIENDGESSYYFINWVNEETDLQYYKGAFSHFPLISVILYNYENQLTDNYYKEILNNAPMCGPRSISLGGVSEQWATLNLLACPWHHEEHHPDGTVYLPNDYFNGLDYMWLYNLYMLVFHPYDYKQTAFKNIDYNFEFYNTSNADYSYPNYISNTFESAKIIESTSKIKNKEIHYRAGEKIILKPGFHATGNHFTAKIDDSIYENIPGYNYKHYCTPLLSAKAYIFEEHDKSLTNNEDINKEVKINNIEIYPNPTKGEITVNSDVIIEKIEISNISGTIVRTIQVNNYNFKTDISELSNGVYLLKLISDTGEIYVEKLIKQ